MFQVYSKGWFHSWVGKIHWRRDRLPTPVFLSFPGALDGKESTYNVEDLGSIPGVGNGNPLQYSCLDNSTDKETWQAIVHGAAKSQT